jgi:hypothetical protein
MKKIFTLTLFILLAASKLFADTHDLDSLKTRLQLTTIDSLKGNIYKQIAAQYLQYDTIKHSGVKRYYQSEALNYTMLALHNYSYYADTLGMRTCFDYLAKVINLKKNIVRQNGSYCNLIKYPAVSMIPLMSLHHL